MGCRGVARKGILAAGDRGGRAAWEAGPGAQWRGAHGCLAVHSDSRDKALRVVEAGSAAASSKQLQDLSTGVTT